MEYEISDLVKIIISALLLIIMGFFVGWIFYMSEPKYIDNDYKVPQKYDIISIPIGEYQMIGGETKIGMVLQMDSSTMLIKTMDNTFINIPINNISGYKIIGKGTFYHKVNTFIGFNIMMVTAIIIIIFSVIILFTLIGILREVMGYKDFF